MTKKFFWDLEHARRYLEHSLLFKNGEPLYIDRVRRPSRKFVAECLPQAMLWGKQVPRQEVEVYDDGVVLSPERMGFIPVPPEWNDHDKFIAIFANRRPSRTWKTGLCEDNLIGSCVGKLASDYYAPGDYLIRLPSLGVVVTGRYPRYEDALKAMDKGNHMQIPLARNWAIQDDGAVLYAKFTKPVGKWTENGIKLDENRDFLQEALDQEVR